MSSVMISLDAGSSLAGRAFSEQYRAFNRAFAGLLVPQMEPVNIIVHVSGDVTDWTKSGQTQPVVRSTPGGTAVSVFIARAAWEEQTREAHREVLISAVASGIEALGHRALQIGDQQSAQRLAQLVEDAARDFRKWAIPDDAILGPAEYCPKCGKKLRTRAARQCPACGAKKTSSGWA